MTVAEGAFSRCARWYKRMLQWGRNLTVAEGGEFGGRIRRFLGVLQWGRNLTVAEGAVSSAGDVEEIMLQWGRNLTVAEGGKKAMIF